MMGTKTKALPTQEEIVERIEEYRSADLLGFEVGEYMLCLDREHIGPYLKESADPEEWEPNACDRDSLLEKMRKYMSFAWDKANGCRGISAERSVRHYVAWTWLAGDPEFSDEIRAMPHQYYGKPALVRVCEYYGWDWREWDDDRWTNYEGSPGVTADDALGGQP